MYPRFPAIHNIAIRRFLDTCPIHPRGSIHQRRDSEKKRIAASPGRPLLMLSDPRTSLIQPFKENDMKVSMIALTFAASVIGSVAHAAVPTPSTGTVDSSQIAQAAQPQWSASTASVAGKTRAQVRQELVQAEKDGQLANLNRSLYMGS
jgi:hypothetical protein